MAAASKRWPCIEYVADMMFDNGVPVKREMNGRDFRVGPILITSTAYTRIDAVRRYYGDTLRDAGEKGVTVVVLNGRGDPGDMRGADVLMSLEGLAQILTWLIQGDPGNFLRPLKNRGMRE